MGRYWGGLYVWAHFVPVVFLGLLLLTGLLFVYWPYTLAAFGYMLGFRLMGRLRAPRWLAVTWAALPPIALFGYITWIIQTTPDY